MTTLEHVLGKFNLDPAGNYDGAMPLNLPNFSRGDLAKLFAELGFTTGAEIGVETGLYSEVLCKANPSLDLYCIDAWKAYRGYREHVSQSKVDGLYQKAKERLEWYASTYHRITALPGESIHAREIGGPRASVHLLRGFSMDVVGLFPDEYFEFVFIDGNHTLEHVSQDIEEWSKKVKPGGIVSGHDYFRPKNNDECKYGVIEAVNAYTQAHNIRPWFVARGDDPKAPSFFWVKE